MNDVKKIAKFVAPVLLMAGAVVIGLHVDRWWQAKKAKAAAKTTTT